MEDLNGCLKNMGFFLRCCLLVMILICIMYNRREEHIPETDSSSETDLRKTESDELSEEERWEKGYDLPIEEEKKEEAETECFVIMDRLSDIYMNADKGDASNVVLSDETLDQMQDVVGESGSPVITSEIYCTMSNYEKMDQFLKDCLGRERYIYYFV